VGCALPFPTAPAGWISSRLCLGAATLADYAGLAEAADLPRYPLLAAAWGGGAGEPTGQGGARR